MLSVVNLMPRTASFSLGRKSAKSCDMLGLIRHATTTQPNTITSSAQAGFSWMVPKSLARIKGKKNIVQIAKRNFMLHEYQAAQLLHKYMIPIPLGNVAFTAKEAFFIGRKFGSDFDRRFVVKA